MALGLKRKLQPVCFTAVFLLALIAGPVAWAWGGTAVLGADVVGSEAYPRSINVKQAKEKRDEGVFFLDVRESSEWVQMHIPGSALIPLGQLRNRLGEIPKDREVVVVCLSGSRSLMALDILRSNGFSQTSSMYGGLRLWQQVGYPLEKGN